MERFKGIEPLLKQWFNIDRYTPALSKCISFSIRPNQLIKTKFPEEYRNKDGNIDIHRYSFDHSDVIQVPISSDYNTDDLKQFFRDYSIEENTIIYDILFFMFIYSETLRKDYSTPIDEVENDYLQYAVGVRPEMLKLYIALTETAEKDTVKIRFGNNKAVEVDTMVPWLRDELKEYLDKYLGVKSIKEAKQELLMNYTNRMGAPNNWQTNQYIWGVYNLLNETGFIKSQGAGKVSRKQAKFIEDYLLATDIINIDSNIDANNIRSRLNSLMKNYDSIEQITEDMHYKSSSNNINGIRLF
jgi:hypothetical protein